MFKCKWPSRFGNHGVLAAKVVPNPEDDRGNRILKSFIFESGVLTKYT